MAPTTTTAAGVGLPAVDEVLPSSRPATSNASAEFFRRLDILLDGQSLIDHPFHRRWFEGSLDPVALRIYTSEQHHLIQAANRLARNVAESVEGPLGTELVLHAMSVSRKEELWLEFARSVGWGGMGAIYFAEDPFPETVCCAELLSGSGQSAEQMLITLYGLMSRQPELNRMLLAGLLAADHGDETSTAYFRIDWSRDLQHAATARDAICAYLPQADQEALLFHAEEMQRSRGAALDAIDSHLAR